ncbi:MAG: hypothetical protein KKE83_02045 [Proteobacteria bacterium]|nr:hypothetical protein [Bacteroidota bacterium]MBU2618447.1 hypothetical protein [Pseudomonadota bacterium]
MKEEDFTDFLSWLLDDHSYTFNKCRKVENFCRFLAKTENQFLISQFKKPTLSFLDSAQKLIDYISLKFFVYPSMQTQEDTKFCMQPCWNIDRDGSGSTEESKNYDRLTKELEKLIIDIQKDYIELRNNIKMQIFI